MDYIKDLGLISILIGSLALMAKFILDTITRHTGWQHDQLLRVEEKVDSLQVSVGELHKDKIEMWRRLEKHLGPLE